jgi:hypothetical protein
VNRRAVHFSICREQQFNPVWPVVPLIAVVRFGGVIRIWWVSDLACRADRWPAGVNLMSPIQPRVPVWLALPAVAVLAYSARLVLVWPDAISANGADVCDSYWSAGPARWLSL